MKRITITGAESTGKTTLACDLATHYNTAWVPEYAREYLSHLDMPYCEEDLLHIAEGQMAQIRKFEKVANEILICDTGILVIKIWSEEKFGRVHPKIKEMLSDYPVDLYVLTGWDIPYEADPLRENPRDRERLYHLYEEALRSLQTPFIMVNGSPKDRLSKAVDAIDALKLIHS